MASFHQVLKTLVVFLIPAYLMVEVLHILLGGAALGQAELPTLLQLCQANLCALVFATRPI
jgi:hypothetical protein